MPLPSISILDLETLMDALAYLLATDSRTSTVNWALGDAGFGKPPPLPFGYVSYITESPIWYTANGGLGGMAAGLDDWRIPISILVCFEPHRYPDPVIAIPPSGSPFNAANLGTPVPYMEVPGWRTAMQYQQNIKKTLRTNITVGGAATDIRIVEGRFLLQEVNDKIYRAARVGIEAQQRRVRGN